jgi:hypothetical protein
MLAWLVVLQQLEGWVIYPLVQGRILSLSPIVVVLGVLAGATIYGVLGALIAVPIVAIVDVVLREVVFPLRQRRQRRRISRRPARRRPASVAGSGDALRLLADVVDEHVLAEVLRLDVEGAAAVDPAHEVDELGQVARCARA